MTTGFVAEFSFCVPSATRNEVIYGLIFHTVLDYTSQNSDRRSLDILTLKGTKHRLYMIKYQWYFSNVNLTFQFSFRSITGRGFEK
jgi:hypothetical protein